MSPNPVPFAPAASSAEARVRDARPDLHPDSSAFRAALVLLAGPEMRFNVDRVAVRCRLPRAQAAACVRRLIDNGVWGAGGAACPWHGPGDPRFWNDVAVAEGRLLRRTHPDGRVEWAPPGRWEKAYDFVGPQSDPGGAVLYLDATQDASPLDPPLPATATAADVPRPPPRALPAVFPGAVLTGAGGWRDADAEPVPAGAAAGLPELFPGADWLR